MSSLPPSSIPLPEKRGGGLALLINFGLAGVLTALAFVATAAGWALLTILTNSNIWYAAAIGGLAVGAALAFAFRHASRWWGLITVLPAIALACLAILLGDIAYYSYIRAGGELNQMPAVLERTALSIFNILSNRGEDLITYFVAGLGALGGSFARRA
jgi:hypothetical protein